MRVALLNSFYPPDVVGGAEVVTRALAVGLAQRGIEVEVIALGARGADRVDGIRVHHVPLANVFWPPAREGGSLAVTGLFHAIDRHNPIMAARVRALLAERRYDLLHTHNLLGFSTAVWEAAHAERVPIVHTLHDQRLLCHRGSGVTREGEVCARRCFECRVVGAGKREATGAVSAVIGVSRWILERHLAAGAFAHARAHVIANAAELAPPRARAGDGPLRIGFLGRLVPEKGARDVIDAVRGLPGVELAIAGDGPERAALERAASGAPVTLLGKVPRERVLDAADVLVVPSRWHEPFGLVAAEAAVRGIPVIASRRGGLPEIVEDGVTGWLYEPDHAGALRAAIVRARDDRARLAAIGRAARRRASRFHPERQIDAYLRVYRREIAASSTAVRTPAVAAISWAATENRRR